MATAIQPIEHRCWICGKEVSLQTCKTDEKGHVVHEHCYTVRMQLEGASSRVGLNRGPATVNAGRLIAGSRRHSGNRH